MPLANDIYPGTLYIDGVPASTAIVLETLEEHLDASPATLQFHLPEIDSALARDLRGRQVALVRGGRYQFVGHIRHSTRRGTASDLSARCIAYDARHELKYRVVGQYGIGELAGSGGWAGVGYDVEFNPQRHPNRTPYAPPVSLTDGIRLPGVFRFTRPSHAWAAEWTWKDVLIWLLNWYCDDSTMLVDTTIFDAHPVLLQNAVLGDVSSQSVSGLLTRILNGLGLHWTIRYDTRADNRYGYAPAVGVFTILGAAVSAPATRTLYIPPQDPLHDTAWPDHRSVPDYLCTEWVVTEDDTNACDRTEVHADPPWYETVWEYNGTDPATGLDYTTDLLQTCLPRTAGYSYAFCQARNRLYTNAVLADGGIGAAPLPYPGPGADEAIMGHYWNRAASFSLPWKRSLIEEDDVADRTGDAPEDEITNQAAKASENLYFKCADVGVTVWTRIKSGARIDYAAGVIELKSAITPHPVAIGASTEPVNLEGVVQIRFNVVTRLPLRTVEISPDDDISGAMPRTRLVRIQRLAEGVASNCFRNSTATDPDTGVEMYTGSVTTVHSIADELGERMEALHLAEASNGRRTLCVMTLPKAPAIHIGDAVRFSDYNPGIPTSGMRVVGVTYDNQAVETKITISDAFI